MHRSVAVGLLAVLLLASATFPVGTALASQPNSAESLKVQQNFDESEFIIHVYENGSARWTLEYSQPLQNETERKQFNQFAKRFNSSETELYTDFKTRSSELTAEGEKTTGREMEATGYSKRAYVKDSLSESSARGIVSMSFTWTNFAQTNGDRLKVGDVFEGGLYIGPNQSLVITHSDSLAFTDAGPTNYSSSKPGSLSRSDSVTWEGEKSFSDNRPYVILTTDTQAATDSGGNGARDGTPGASPSKGPLTGGTFLFPMVAGAFALVIGAVIYAYRSGVLGDGAPSPSEASDGGTDNGSGGAAASTSEPAISDEELLSDEDRVMNLLEERGGRMKQVNIVDETGWSKSKVSMLLSEMEEEEAISKLRVGRENIVSIAGQEPEAAGSPFDDEE